MRNPHQESVQPQSIRRLVLPAWLAIFAIVSILATGCGDRSNTFSPEIEQTLQETVTSARCGLCHGPYLPATFDGTYYQDWIQTAHGESGNTIPSDQTIVADIDDDGVNDFKNGFDLGTLPDWTQYTLGGGAGGDFAPLMGFNGVTGKYTVTIGSRVFKVSKVIGVGRRKQAYLTRMGASSYILPALYDVKLRMWFPLIPENWFTWVDMNNNGYIDEGETIVGLLYPTTFDTPVIAGRTADAWERNCIGCHESGFRSLARNSDGEFVAEFNEDGVGCESCHGPGGEHSSTLGGKDLPDRAIVNPSELTASQQRDLCMSCHSRGTSVGIVGGMNLEFPWNPDDTPFLPGQKLSKAFTLGVKDREPIHTLQGNQTHMGMPGSIYGSWHQDCQDCHSAHNTTNLKLVRMTVETPSSGKKPVVYTARNGPQGSGGLMGDASDATFSDICEVCHTQTFFFRNNGSTPITDHFNGELCTNCHDHSNGLLRPDGIGGTNCAECHDYLFLNTRSHTPAYGHLLADDDIGYPTFPVEWRCVTCHVDHDIFEPGTSAQSGRGANLRTDILEVPGQTSGFTNTDFVNGGNGGLCISCHRQSWLKSYQRPDGSFTTPPIPYMAPVADQIAAYNGAMHGGFYQVTTQFENAQTNTFDASCTKCHNDDLDPKSGVNGQVGPLKMGIHKSTKSRMLSPMGFDGSANPLEENFCYRCHSRVGDPVGGATKPNVNRDWYGDWFMTDRAEGLFDVVQKPYGHQVANFSELHKTIEGTAYNWNSGNNRHVECEDCHNPHANQFQRFFDFSGTFAQPITPTNLTANTPNSFVWGVDVPSWPPSWTLPNPATAYTRVENSTFIWQVCLKCHSGYGYGSTPPALETDQALEFNPNNASYHACIGDSKTTFPPNTSFEAPWTKTSLMSCADCHTSDAKNDPQGPHGSTHKGILAGAFDQTTGRPGTEDHLCFKCHSFDVYGRNGNAGWTATGFSDGDDNLHTVHAEENHHNAGRKITCFDCHAAVPHGWFRRSLLIAIGDPAPYNNGSAALDATNIQNGPSSGNWNYVSCINSPCH